MAEISWTHPTGRAPKTVALVCLGPSRDTYIGGLFEHDLDEAVTGCDEVWTLNRGGNLFRHDLLWIMDHIQGEADQYPNYGASLWKHDQPIITSDNFAGWPDHVRAYPFDLIWNWLATQVQPMHGSWFHNSVAYIVVYAAFIGVKELRVFGADYSNHSSGVVEDGHPNVAYWVGKMESQGLTVKVPASSGFLNSNKRGWIYGYQYDPRIIPNHRKRFRDLVGLPAESGTQLWSGERQVASAQDGIQPDHVHRYRWAAERLAGKVIDIGAGVGYGSKILAEVPAVTSVLAVDRSQESLEYGNLHYADPKITRALCDLAKTDDRTFAQAGPFDTAIAFELIEHLVDPKPLLKNLPAQRLLASVPNEAVIPFSANTAPHHFRHYHRHEFAALFQECGWAVMGWYGQMDRESPVIPWQEGCRTLIVEAQSCGLSNTTTKSGD